MSVYVDSMSAQYGRMKMCHMMADTTEELLAMADTIGVDRKWLQDAGSHREHFDVCKTKREQAIKAGAIVATWRDLSSLMRRKKHGANTPTTEQGS